MSETKPAIDLLALLNAYDTDRECRAYLEELRWPNGLSCPRCRGKSISRIKERKQFDCDTCRYQFSVTAGTIFHDSHLGLPKWLVAVYLLCESKKGMSANQLKRLLKVSYKTAWYLCHRIRAAMSEANPVPLTGTVEMDETYIGRGRGMGSGNRDRHTMIPAAIERGGRVRMSTGQRKPRTRAELHRFMEATIDDKAANIYTDEAIEYRGIQDQKTRNLTVTVSLGEYVRGDVPTNTVESAFSLFKRSIVGSFHQISSKHLDAYLDEFEWRLNNRKNPYVFRDTLLKLIGAEKLEYKQLTKAAS
jgi:transposase-like protein